MRGLDGWKVFFILNILSGEGGGEEVGYMSSFACNLVYSLRRNDVGISYHLSYRNRFNIVATCAAFF